MRGWIDANVQVRFAATKPAALTRARGRLFGRLPNRARPSWRANPRAAGMARQPAAAPPLPHEQRLPPQPGLLQALLRANGSALVVSRGSRPAAARAAPRAARTTVLSRRLAARAAGSLAYAVSEPAASVGSTTAAARGVEPCKCERLRAPCTTGCFPPARCFTALRCVHDAPRSATRCNTTRAASAAMRPVREARVTCRLQQH